MNRAASARVAGRCIILMLSGTILGACRGYFATPPPPPETESSTLPESVTTMRGIDLYIHGAEATAGTAERPLFWVHAETFSVHEEDDTWDFEDARAVVYPEDKNGDPVIFDAARGRFEQDRGARLEGGVTGHIGPLTMELEEVTWEKADGEGRGTAWTDHPVVLDDPNMHLEAQSMRLEPDTKAFTLTHVTGEIRFGRSEP